MYNLKTSFRDFGQEEKLWAKKVFKFNINCKKYWRIEGVIKADQHADFNSKIMEAIEAFLENTSNREGNILEAFQ